MAVSALTNHAATHCNIMQVIGLNERECMLPMRQRMQREHRGSDEPGKGVGEKLCTLLILFGENKHL